MKHLYSVRLASIAIAGFALAVAPAWSQRPKQSASKPRPQLADVSYGPHPRNVLDVWQAKTDAPAPLVVYIHGGGFRKGSKESLSPGLLSRLLARGISVMAIDYRLSPQVSFPAHYLDSARAIQFARANAREWNLDAKRIGVTGGSAGAGTALWIGFHDDMADPKSPDPVLRESTRLTCMAVIGAQSSYDPRVVKAWVSESASKHPALDGFFGVTDETRDTPEAHRRYEAASPITHLTRDDPPVFAYYAESRIIPPDAKPGVGIHHINFGLRLKEKMEGLGIECIVRHQDEGANSEAEIFDFFVRHLLVATKTR